MPRGVRWWLLTLGLSAAACGQSTKRSELPRELSIDDLPPHTQPYPTGGSSGSGGSGGTTSSGSGGGSGEAAVDGGAPNAPDGGVDDLPAVRVDDVPPCGIAAPTSLADEARGDAALALDAANVYYVGLRGVSAVPKGGGEARVLGPADGTQQVAVDAESVYFGGRSFWRTPKAGGDVTLMLDGQVAGIVGTSEHVYFTNWAITPTSVQRWSPSGGFEMFERFAAQFWVPQLLADETFVYVAQGATSPAMPIERVRMSDGSIETLTQGEVIRGVALGGGNFYFSDEASRSVKVVHLADLSTETILRVADSPTGLAADADHIYLNLQAIMPGGTKYHGHLVRFTPNGDELCELSTSIEYGPSVAVDDTNLYWIGERQLWTVAK